MQCLITIRPVGRPAWCYRGIFPSTFDAVIHGLSLTVGEQVRVSARVLA